MLHQLTCETMGAAIIASHPFCSKVPKNEALFIAPSIRDRKNVVLLYNGGPESFKKLSDICQKSVRKLSVTKKCQKTVINVSEFCQKTVRCKYLSEIYQKRFGNASEMCQIL